MDPFETERKAYEAMRRELLARHGGQYAIFDGDRLIGVKDSLDEAVDFGLVTTGKFKFFVQHIVQEEERIVLPAYVTFA